ncbi:hypothetical protein KDL44_04205 [bacterium]|nr:hypothetical protein [bacterium]
MTRGRETESVMELRQPDNPVELLLERLQRQSREYRRGWFSRPMFVTIAAVLFLITVILISRQHWALSLHDPLATNPLYVQSSRIVAVMACLWFYFNLSMLMAFSRMLSAASQGLQLLSTGRARSNTLRIDDLLQGNPLDSATIFDGLTGFHRRRIAPLLWFPCMYVLLGAVLKFPLPLFDNGKLQWHWQFLLIPLVAPMFHFICMAVFRLLLHVSILIGRRITHPVGQQLMLWLLLGSPLFVMLLLQLVIRGQGIPQDSAKLLSLGTTGLLLLVPLLLSRLLRARALAAIESVASGRHDRQAVEARSSAGGDRDSTPSRLLKPTYAVVLGLPLLLAVSVFIHTLRMQQLKPDTGDPFIDWYFGYAQQTVERRWLQRLDATPARIPEPGTIIADGHFYIHELMQQAEPQFGDDPRWQRLRYELLSNAHEMPLALDFEGAVDNEELASKLIADAIASGVENPPGELWLLQSQWIEYRDAARQLVDPGASSELESQRLKLHERARELAIRLNEAAPLYWIAMSDHDLLDVQVLELIRLGNTLPCSFHTGSFRKDLARAIPAGDKSTQDRVQMGMQPLDQLTNQDFAVINAIHLKDFIKRLAAQQDREGLEQVRRMLVQQLATDDLNEISYLIALVCLSSCASGINAHCQPDAAQQRALGEFDTIAMQLRTDFKQMLRNGTWDLAAQLDRQSREYLPVLLPAQLVNPLQGIESRLSLGRHYAFNFYYELNPQTLQEIEVLDWYRRHRPEIERLSQFDFETISWRDEHAGNDE